MRNKKAFTLIELIAVLVILAILALIVTPIVMSIINKAKTSANKRSIDAYGRSIELAIASHMLDTGEIPESIDELTIEYNGDEVVCETQELKSDSTVYLAGCTVGGKTVEGYTYGKSSSSDSENTSYEAYQIGDHVSYNNVTYYVIEDSDASNDTVKMLKEEPLLKSDIEALNLDISIETYGSNYGYVVFGNNNVYDTSIVKQIVNGWAGNEINSTDFIDAGLISHEDLISKFGYENRIGTVGASSNGTTPVWIYNSNYSYWTMSSYGDSVDSIWVVRGTGEILNKEYQESSGTIRPVLELNKSANITKID